MNGMYTGENVRTLIEIIEHAKNNEQLGLILFSDFLTAFDSLDDWYSILDSSYFKYQNE